MDKEFLNNNSFACPSLLIYKERLAEDKSSMEMKIRRKERRLAKEESKLNSQVKEAFNIQVNFYFTTFFYTMFRKNLQKQKKQRIPLSPLKVKNKWKL